jgi:molybdopterin-guanine dinucleotide biosynthesis protein MobB
MLTTAHVPILGFVAYSGTGKTTLLLKIIPLMKDRGLHVGVIKHTHHKFDIDQPGKDSYRIRHAGADQTLVASRQRWALMVETGHFREPYLDHLLTHLDQDKLDLILVEGFKHEKFPKIEIYRPSLGFSLMFPEDDSIIAVASDAPLPLATNLPLLDLNEPEQVVTFIQQRFLDGN